MGQKKIVSNLDRLIDYWKSKGFKGQHEPSFDIYGVIAVWGSKGAEDQGNGTFARREFTFFENTWSLYFTLYLDAELKSPVFRFHAEGFFEVDSPSSVVEGAYNAMFGFQKKTLTLRTSDEKIINSFGFGGCGLQLEVEKDISDTGCSFFKSVKDYEEEYDLLCLDKTRKVLYLGARPADNDMSTKAKRPTALGYPLLRI
ncbi:MAG: hypothetical protein HQL05_00215 [Nitrospirae bacterium]|nr:hypothetical protein [Nitrospirota bacterium]